MLAEASPRGDGVSLARSVRVLAARAREALARPADPAETRELLREIGELVQESRDYSSEDVRRWLSSLRRRVERHAGQSA